MKLLLTAGLLLVLLVFALYQVRIALKNIKDSKINPEQNSPQDRDKDNL